MLVLERWEKDAKVIILSGRFDKSARVGLETAIAQAEEARCHHIILDLANVSSIDSAGIGKLFLTYRHLQRKSIQLSLLDPRPVVQEILNLVELSKVLAIHKTDQDVLTAA